MKLIDWVNKFRHKKLKYRVVARPEDEHGEENIQAVRVTEPTCVDVEVKAKVTYKAYPRREEVLQALDGSVDKWVRISEGREVDYGAVNCPLCHLFRQWDCRGCPVVAVTKKPGCNGSPYSDWHGHHSVAHMTDRHKSFHEPHVNDGCDECGSLAKAEALFLEEVKRRYIESETNENRYK